MVPVRSPPTSGLAIAALVLAVVPCCPAISLVGTVLGVAALRRIQAANGALAGRSIAKWAIGIGITLAILSTMGMTILVQHAEQTNREIISTQIAEVIDSSRVQQPDRAAKAWNNASANTPTTAEFQRFGQEVAQRYGRLQRFSISSMTTGGSLFRQRIEVAGVYIFQNVERTGSAIFDVQPRAGDLWPQFHLTALTIEDRDHGDLKLPPEASTP